MSVYLTASWDLPAMQIRLPNPIFGDWDSPTNEVKIAKSMNNTLRTFIKTKDGRRKINFTFETTRAKAIETFEFYRAHLKDELKIEDHLNRTWRGEFSVNPIDLESSRSYLEGPNPQATGENITRFTLEFEAKQQ